MSLESNLAVITGIGSVTNFGRGYAAAWDGQLRGVAVTRSRTAQYDVAGHTTKTTQAPPAKDLEGGLRKLEYPRPSRSTLMALIAAREAWSMADIAEPNPQRTGLMMSRCFGELDIQEHYYRILQTKGPGAVSGLEFVQSLANTVLGRVALELRARGPSVMVVGPPVFGLALDALRADEADVIVVGGMDQLSDYICDLCDAQAITPASRGYPEQPAPYSHPSGGLVPGDGAAFLVLERESYARARGAHPIATLKGSATVMDPHCTDGIRRSSAAVGAAIELALNDAEVDGKKIGLVSGAATGLSGYDDVEMEAIATKIGSAAITFSTKQAHGETWGAAGAISLASAAQALWTGLVPAQPGSSSATSTKPGVEVVLSLSFDVPGSISAHVVGSYEY